MIQSKFRMDSCSKFPDEIKFLKEIGSKIKEENLNPSESIPAIFNSSIDFFELSKVCLNTSDPDIKSGLFSILSSYLSDNYKMELNSSLWSLLLEMASKTDSEPDLTLISNVIKQLAIYTNNLPEEVYQFLASDNSINPLIKCRLLLSLSPHFIGGFMYKHRIFFYQILKYTFFNSYLPDQLRVSLIHLLFNIHISLEELTQGDDSQQFWDYMWNFIFHIASDCPNLIKETMQNLNRVYIVIHELINQDIPAVFEKCNQCNIFLEDPLSDETCQCLVQLITFSHFYSPNQFHQVLVLLFRYFSSVSTIDIRVHKALIKFIKETSLSEEKIHVISSFITSQPSPPLLLFMSYFYDFLLCSKECPDFSAHYLTDYFQPYLQSESCSLSLLCVICDAIAHIPELPLNKLVMPICFTVISNYSNHKDNSGKETLENAFNILEILYNETAIQTNEFITTLLQTRFDILITDGIDLLTEIFSNESEATSRNLFKDVCKEGIQRILNSKEMNLENAYVLSSALFIPSYSYLEEESLDEFFEDFICYSSTAFDLLNIPPSLCNEQDQISYNHYCSVLTNIMQYFTALAYYSDENLSKDQLKAEFLFTVYQKLNEIALGSIIKDECSILVAGRTIGNIYKIFGKYQNFVQNPPIDVIESFLSNSDSSFQKIAGTLLRFSIENLPNDKIELISNFIHLGKTSNEISLFSSACSVASLFIEFNQKEQFQLLERQSTGTIIEENCEETKQPPPFIVDFISSIFQSRLGFLHGCSIFSLTNYFPSKFFSLMTNFFQFYPSFSSSYAMNMIFWSRLSSINFSDKIFTTTTRALVIGIQFQYDQLFSEILAKRIVDDWMIPKILETGLDCLVQMEKARRIPDIQKIEFPRFGDILALYYSSNDFQASIISPSLKAFLVCPEIANKCLSFFSEIADTLKETNTDLQDEIDVDEAYNLVLFYLEKIENFSFERMPAKIVGIEILINLILMNNEELNILQIDSETKNKSFEFLDKIFHEQQECWLSVKKIIENQSFNQQERYLNEIQSCFSDLEPLYDYED